MYFCGVTLSNKKQSPNTKKDLWNKDILILLESPLPECVLYSVNSHGYISLY